MARTGVRDELHQSVRHRSVGEAYPASHLSLIPWAQDQHRPTTLPAELQKLLGQGDQEIILHSFAWTRSRLHRCQHSLLSTGIFAERSPSRCLLALSVSSTAYFAAGMWGSGFIATLRIWYPCCQQPILHCCQQHQQSPSTAWSNPRSGCTRNRDGEYRSMVPALGRTMRTRQTGS